MKLNIQRFKPDAWELNATFSNYKYNTTGRLIQVTLKIMSNYNINSIYDIDSEGNENYAYSLWNVHNGVGTYPYSEVPYIERTFYNLNDLKGVKVTTYETSQNKTITYNFEMDASGEEEKTTYITKTSATAVLKGNVLNNLNTYDYNNAPSVAAVRNYLDSGSLIHQSDVDDIISQAVSNALLAAHPVGSIEINMTGTNPSEYLGGTWEQIKDVFLLSAGDTYAGGSTGGEATHKLTNAELPKLNGHFGVNVLDNYQAYLSGVFSAGGLSGKGRGVGNNSDYPLWGIQFNAGNDQPHNNMPPYLVVYVWKRIS